MTLTYMFMKEEKIIVGTAPDLVSCLKLCKDQGALETYVLRGDVEKTILETGAKKMFNLVRIVDRYNLSYENKIKYYP